MKPYLIHQLRKAGVRMNLLSFGKYPRFIIPDEVSGQACFILERIKVTRWEWFNNK